LIILAFKTGVVDASVFLLKGRMAVIAVLVFILEGRENLEEKNRIVMKGKTS